MKTVGTLFLVLLLFSVNCIAQKSFEITAGAGYTAVDLDALVEEDEVSGTSVTDWDQFTAGVSIQYFFASFGNIGVGAEFMYQYLYWYQVLVPFGSQPIRREYDVDAYRITPIIRLGNGAFNFDLGPEINILNGVKIGLLASANYNIAVNDKIAIPLKLRLDVMDNIVITAPITFHAGVKINL